MTQEFVMIPSKTANGESIIKFVKILQAKHPQAKILLIWDGASYHRGQEMKTFLAQQNQELLPEEWKITCIRFAPYAPMRKSRRGNLATIENSAQKVLSIWQEFSDCQTSISAFC